MSTVLGEQPFKVASHEPRSSASMVSVADNIDSFLSVVAGGALASNRFGDRTSIDAHESELTAEVPPPTTVPAIPTQNFRVFA